MAVKTVTARIHGRVQGVSYRAWTVMQASALGVAGWVRNRNDGSVEALFHGPAPAVEAMLDACRDGPPLARVSRIDTQASDEIAPPGRFEQRATA